MNFSMVSEARNPQFAWIEKTQEKQWFLILFSTCFATEPRSQFLENQIFMLKKKMYLTCLILLFFTSLFSSIISFKCEILFRNLADLLILKTGKSKTTKITLKQAKIKVNDVYYLKFEPKLFELTKSDLVAL